MREIEYEYDRYLKSIGADEYEEKCNILEGYVKDLKKDIDGTVNQRKDLYKIVDELQELLEEWKYALNDAIDEMKEVDNRKDGFDGYTDDFC